MSVGLSLRQSSSASTARRGSPLRIRTRPRFWAVVMLRGSPFCASASVDSASASLPSFRYWPARRLAAHARLHRLAVAGAHGLVEARGGDRELARVVVGPPEGVDHAAGAGRALERLERVDGLLGLLELERRAREQDARVRVAGGAHEHLLGDVARLGEAVAREQRVAHLRERLGVRRLARDDLAVGGDGARLVALRPVRVAEQHAPGDVVRRAVTYARAWVTASSGRRNSM